MLSNQFRKVTKHTAAAAVTKTITKCGGRIRKISRQDLQGLKISRPVVVYISKLGKKEQTKPKANRWKQIINVREELVVDKRNNAENY